MKFGEIAYLRKNVFEMIDLVRISINLITIVLKYEFFVRFLG